MTTKNVEMDDFVSAIADKIVEDHIELMAREKRLRELLEHLLNNSDTETLNLLYGKAWVDAARAALQE